VARVEGTPAPIPIEEGSGEPVDRQEEPGLRRVVSPEVAVVVGVELVVAPVPSDLAVEADPVAVLVRGPDVGQGLGPDLRHLGAEAGEALGVDDPGLPPGLGGPEVVEEEVVRAEAVGDQLDLGEIAEVPDRDEAVGAETGPEDRPVDPTPGREGLAVQGDEAPLGEDSFEMDVDRWGPRGRPAGRPGLQVTGRPC
jgi:hypothetical protein